MCKQIIIIFVKKKKYFIDIYTTQSPQPSSGSIVQHTRAYLADTSPPPGMAGACGRLHRGECSTSRGVLGRYTSSRGRRCTRLPAEQQSWSSPRLGLLSLCSCLSRGGCQGEFYRTLLNPLSVRSSVCLTESSLGPKGLSGLRRS